MKESSQCQSKPRIAFSNAAKQLIVICRVYTMVYTRDSKGAIGRVQLWILPNEGVINDIVGFLYLVS